MKKLDWYILKRFLGTFIYAILILAVITAVIDYSEKVDDFVKHKAPALQILLFYKNFLPYMIAFLFPLFILISTVFFTSKLAYKSEIIAILASGVSFPRFMRPYMIGGLILCGVSFIANHFLIPAANKDRLIFEDKYIHEAVHESSQNVHLRLTPNLYIYVQSFNLSGNVGFHFTAEEIVGTSLKKKVSADRISYDSVKQEWILSAVTIRTNDSLKESLTQLPELRQRYPFVPKDLYEDNDIMTAMTTPYLNKIIEREKLRGRENLNQYYFEKYRRSAQPFAGLILTVIGACIASKKIRGGSGVHLAVGIAISALYIMALQFSTTFSTKAGLNPLLAAWIPNFIFGALAIYYYRKQIK